MTQEQFIEKAKIKHGNKYDYSKVVYENSQKKVCIICPKHGEFWQVPSAHIRGDNCPKCGNEARGRFEKLTLEQFVEKSKEIHGNKYDYSKVNYKNSSTKVEIICKEHGSFFMTPLAHIYSKQGCPKCAGRNLTTDEIIEKFKTVHGNKYDYSKVVYTKMHEKVCIICPIHGEFWQTPSKHLLGQGCSQCSVEKRSNEKRTDLTKIIENCKKIHGDKYDYELVKYNNVNDKVKIICKKHGIFEQRLYDHLGGHGCPHCANLISKSENEIYDFLSNLIGSENVIKHDRQILSDGKELDIFIPTLQLAIEFNGLRWHSEFLGKNKDYHISKLIECNKKGIKLIQIFEDEFVFTKDIVLAKLKHALFKDNNLPKIYGRNTIIREINKSTAKDFLNKFHIQGYGHSNINLGCFTNNNVLIGVMSFLEINQKYELTRFATNYNYMCVGVGGKLFNYFIENYDFNEIKTFADRRWTTNIENNFYTRIGFKLDKILQPNYQYINVNSVSKRIHKFNFRKQILSKKYDVDLNKTENEITKILGYSKIWDCGLIKYVYKNKKE